MIIADKLHLLPKVFGDLATNTVLTGVDQTALFEIAQTTANAVFTIEVPPTAPINGRVVGVTNTGTTPFTLYGEILLPNDNIVYFTYNGTVWVKTRGRDGNDTHIVRVDAITGVSPTALEVVSPTVGDTAKVYLIDGRVEYWTYSGTTWTLNFTSVPTVLDGNHYAVVRANATANVAPTALEVVSPINGDTASVYLTNGNIEQWAYNGAVWSLVTTTLATVLDGNETQVVRANATTGVAPTALEVPTPVLGDTATVFLNNGTDEYWSFNGATWVLVYTQYVSGLRKMTQTSTFDSTSPVVLTHNWALATVNSVVGWEVGLDSSGSNVDLPNTTFTANAVTYATLPVGMPSFTATITIIG